MGGQRARWRVLILRPCLALRASALMWRRRGADHYRQALRVKPDSAEVHIIWGTALADRGRLAEALEHYRQALQIKPEPRRSPVQPAQCSPAARHGHGGRGVEPKESGITRRGPYTLLLFGLSGLLEVLEGLRQLALLSESQAQGAVGKRIVGLDAEGLPKMFDRLGQLAPAIELISEVVVDDGRVGVNCKRMGPKAL